MDLTPKTEQTGLWQDFRSSVVPGDVYGVGPVVAVHGPRRVADLDAALVPMDRAHVVLPVNTLGRDPVTGPQIGHHHVPDLDEGHGRSGR